MNIYPFKRILLATEHTEFDAGAERVAFAMAKRCGTPLRAIIPIESNPEFEVQAPQLFLRDEEAAAAKVAALQESALNAGIELEVKVRHGMETYREIVEEASATNTDLIIIRRRGKPGILSKRLVGDMVSKVIRDAQCCVLTVPRAAEFWQRGVLASICDMPIAHEIARLSGNISAVCDLPLTFASVAENQNAKVTTESFNASCVATTSTSNNRIQGRVSVGDPTEQIILATKETNADLVVIGRQRYHLIPFIHGHTSIMQKIIGALDVSTLVVPG